jgi:hypothetical protein
MSMSTPQGGGDSSSRKPGTVRVSAKSATSAGKSTGAGKAPGAGRPSGQGNKSGNRRPVPVVKVAQQRNWTPIIITSVVVLLAGLIVWYGVFQLKGNTNDWHAKADSISGIVDYRKKDPQMLTYTSHEEYPINYPMHPPVGGTHNPNWQRCLGDVYAAPIADENAVHSEEHGAIWITYRPDLPADQVAQLAAKVRGNNFMLMSPYPGLDAPISVQTWGFQLKVQNASDKRIDDFINDLRQVSQVEPGVDCSSGSYVTATGSDPHNLDGTHPSAPPPSGTPSTPASPSAPAPSASSSP